MIIEKCYLSAFGKFTAKTFTFNNGLNIIAENNGYGKSTIADFIRVMMYGMAATSSKNISKNMRAKYLPWQGGGYGGYLDFSDKGNEYRIERTFGSKLSEDTFKLYNLKTGNESTDYSNKIGEELLKVDEETFIRTLFFAGEKEINSTSIKDKLNNITGATLENESINKAQDKLEKSMNEIKSKMSNKGLIAELDKKIYNIETEINESLQAGNNLFEFTKQLEESSKKLEQTEEEEKTLNDEIEKAEQCRIVELEQKNYEEKLSKIAELSAEISNTQKNILVKEDELENLSEISKSYSSKRSLRDKLYIGFSIAMVIAVLCVIGFIATKITVLIILSCLILVIGSIVSIVFIMKWNKKLVQNKILLEKYFGKKTEYIDDVYTQQGLITKSKDLTAELNKLKTEIIAPITRDNISTKTTFELRDERQNIYSNRRNLEQQILSIKNKILIAEDIACRENELREEKESLEEQRTELKKRYKLISKTLEFLKEADAELTIKFIEPVKRSISKYLKMITCEDNSNVALDSNLKMEIEENGIRKELGYYSSGYKDLYSTCYRFALTSEIFKDNKPFMILDDPFINLDDSKIGEAMNLLRTISKDVQIIYFSCSITRK
ncbi:MAG: AAA family ATPase [Clostridia bacterium]